MDENKPCQLLGRALFARLEPGHADAELRRELAQRLHRGRARPGLDPADVGVGDAWLGEVSLRETEALSSLPQSSSDCSRRAIGRSCHSAGSLASTSTATGGILPPSARPSKSRARRWTREP